MKRWLILIALLMSSVAWAGSTTVVVGQSASVSYGDDFCTGGTATDCGHDGTSVGAKAFDGTANNTSYWQSEADDPPWAAGHHWVKYDLGSGTTKTAAKIRIKPLFYFDNAWFKGFTLYGSNNDSDWDSLTSGEVPNADGWSEFTFSNSTAYRYYRVTVTSTWYASGVFDDYAAIDEIELMEVAP